MAGRERREEERRPTTPAHSGETSARGPVLVALSLHPALFPLVLLLILEVEVFLVEELVTDGCAGKEVNLARQGGGEKERERQGNVPAPRLALCKLVVRLTRLLDLKKA